MRGAINCGLMTLMPLLAACGGTKIAPANYSHALLQPVLSSKSIPYIDTDGYRFRDLNRNGVLDPYEDWRLRAADRAADLLNRMTLAEMAGELMVPGLNPNAPFGQQATGHDLAQLRQLIGVDHATHINIRLAADAATLAKANNQAQEVAESGRLGIPLTISTDSRHGYTALAGASFAGGTFSSWPNSIGFAALRDEQLVRRQADLVRRDLRSVGISMLLGPQIDLASEPRWPRIFETYGEDPQVARRLAAAFVAGLQGSQNGLASGGVAAIVKHFVGYGASANGFDAHNRYGRFSEVNADEFELQLQPFEGALSARPAGVMPAYSILRGLEINGRPVEQVGGAFNRQIVAAVLRDRLGFTGIVMSDFAVVNDCGEICKNGFPDGVYPSFDGVSMAWGVENLTRAQRVAKAFAAGVDQFGGLEDIAPILEAVREGLITEQRLDQSVLRVLETDLALGLFENPYVDPEVAAVEAKKPENESWAQSVQARSMVLLESDGSMPLSAGTKVVLFGVGEAAARQAGLVPVTNPKDAQVAILRTASPFEHLHPNFTFGSMQQEGSLEFKPDDPVLVIMRRLPDGLPLVVDVRLDRPAILGPFKARANVLLASFGASDAALLSGVTGKVEPEGRLPFELPSSMEAVERQKPGTPADSTAPLYRLGYRFADRD